MSNPLLDHEPVLKAGEWRALADLLRGYADGDPESVVPQSTTPQEQARRFADVIDPDTETTANDLGGGGE